MSIVESIALGLVALFLLVTALLFSVSMLAMALVEGINLLWRFLFGVPRTARHAGRKNRWQA